MMFMMRMILIALMMVSDLKCFKPFNLLSSRRLVKALTLGLV